MKQQKKFYLFSFGFVCSGKGHLQMTDSGYITPCITFLLHCASDVNVSLKTSRDKVFPDMLYMKT